MHAPWSREAYLRPDRHQQWWRGSYLREWVPVLYASYAYTRRRSVCRLPGRNGVIHHHDSWKTILSAELAKAIHRVSYVKLACLSRDGIPLSWSRSRLCRRVQKWPERAVVLSSEDCVRFSPLPTVREWRSCVMCYLFEINQSILFVCTIFQIIMHMKLYKNGGGGGDPTLTD